MIAWFIAGAGFVLMVLATRADDTRDHRWIKIVPSTILLWIIGRVASEGAPGGFMAFVLSGLLAGVWAPVLSHHLSGWAMDHFHRFSTDTGGFRVDYTEARVQIDREQYPEAIAAVQQELRKDPHNYEGLMLLASIYRETRQPLPAAAALDVILRNPAATDDQKRLAQGGKDQLRREFGPVV